jgi:hypothetical protein
MVMGLPPKPFHYQDAEGRWHERRAPEAEAPPPAPTVTYVAGLDLGQAGDYSALAVAEQTKVGKEPATFAIRALSRWRLGTSYPSIVADVGALLQRPPLAGHASLVVDATGVGRPVVDLLRGVQRGWSLVPVTITAGEGATSERGEWRCSKIELISTLTLLLQTGRLRVAARLPEAKTLIQELQGYQRRITPAANVQYGAWREGAHDDVLLATALACWYAERVGSAPLQIWVL